MNIFQMIERAFCITMLFVSLYYTQELPTLKDVIQHQQEKQSNKEKFNATLRELVTRQPSKEILYDKEREVIYIDHTTNFIFMSQLNVTNAVRLFRDMMFM